MFERLKHRGVIMALRFIVLMKFWEGACKLEFFLVKRRPDESETGDGKMLRVFLHMWGICRGKKKRLGNKKDYHAYG